MLAIVLKVGLSNKKSPAIQTWLEVKAEDDAQVLYYSDLGPRSEPSPLYFQLRALGSGSRTPVLHTRLEHCGRNQKKKVYYRATNQYIKLTNTSLARTTSFTSLNNCILLAFDARKKAAASLNRRENGRGEVI